MPRPLNEIIAHIRMVVANPQVSTTLIQTEDLGVLCDAAEDNDRLRAALSPFASYYDMNDCQERAKIPDNALEVPIADLLAAKLALAPQG